MNNHWLVLSEGQQLGPYPGEQLVQLAQEGIVTPEMLVWTEGMAEWLPAAQIPGLFAPLPAAPVAAAPVTTAPAWAPPGTRAATTSATAPQQVMAAPAATTVAAPGGPYPYFKVKPAGFVLWMWTTVGSILSLILMIVCFTTAASLALKAGEVAGLQEEAQLRAKMGLFMMALSQLCSVISMVFFLMNFHRAWSCLQPGGARTTPGKAVWFLLIPFFNLYWIFVAIAGLPKDWNRIMASYQGLEHAPRLNETFFLLFCIGCFIAPLGFVMAFPVMSQVCKAVNFFAFRHDPNSPGALAPPGFGGLRFS